MTERDSHGQAEGDASALHARSNSRAAKNAKDAKVKQRQGLGDAKEAANKPRDKGKNEGEVLDWDALPNLPQSTPQMFHGVLGRLAQQAANGTEVNPACAMLAAMGWASAAVGRNHILPVGDGWHRPNLFTLHVGRSNKGGKGMALDLLRRVVRAVGKLPDQAGLNPLLHSGGLSSTEGLICLVHDGYRDGKTEHPPIEDKRLFVIENEFVNVLVQGKRDGNTLSATLRNTWDGQSLAPAVKNARVWASRPHIALHGCITPGELRRCMAANDLSNGFANRLLLGWGERTGVIPFPQSTPESIVQGLAEELAEAVRPALDGYPQSKNETILRLHTRAAGLYAERYHDFAKPHPAGELITGLLQRRAPMLLRIALLLALMDGERQEVQRVHVECAAAWMDYFAQSVAFVFAPMADAEGEAHRNEDAEKLHAWLVQAGTWRSRSQIVTDCFAKHLPKPAIDAAIERLNLEARIQRRDVPTSGRARTEYRAQATSETDSRSSFAASSQAPSQPESATVFDLSPTSPLSPQQESDTQGLAELSSSIARARTGESGRGSMTL